MVDGEILKSLERDLDAGCAEEEAIEAAVRTIDERGAQAATAIPKSPSSGTRPVGAPSGLFVRERIGRGGLAEVFAADQESLRREVAVKASHNKRAELAERAARLFVGEARITGRLNHPNIVPIHDLVLDSSSPLLVMKRVVGHSWKERLRARRGSGRFDAFEELEVLLEVCDAIAFSHSKGVLHLDIKPANVMVGDYGEVLVMDWGCARIFEEDGWEEQPELPRSRDCRAPLGTPAYLSPEQARGEGPLLGPPADVYLLAAIALEILTGQPPRSGRSSLAAIREAAAAREVHLPKTLPLHLRKLLAEALAPDAGRRIQSVIEFQGRLAHFLNTRESRQITDQADAQLAELRRSALDALGSDRLLALIAAYQQAVLIWPDNAQARSGEARARKELAGHALLRGEADLAEAQANALPEEDPDREVFKRRATELRLQRERTVRQTRNLRLSLAAALATIFLSISVALVVVNDTRKEAEHQADLAASRLAEIERFSVNRKLRQLMAEESALWPSLPRTLHKMQLWMKRVEALEADLLVASSGVAAGNRTVDAAAWHGELLDELTVLKRKLRQSVVPSVAARIALAQSLKEAWRSEHADAWNAASKRLAQDSRFQGTQLFPQIGLVPLGPDPLSQLEEFAYLPSGQLPSRTPAGRIQLTEDSAIVLVLLPGGRFKMGASANPSSPHFDPHATGNEGPVHDVQLDPYFMSKFELTQAQWLRVMSDNPAAFPIGTEVLGQSQITGLHPVEQVSWHEAQEVAARLGLTLPTEAQWEVASRAGSKTRFWTGSTVSSLRGAANLADEHCRKNGCPASWKFVTGHDDGHVVHAPVGSYRPNDYGLHDTVGNVWEWCRDSSASYTALVDSSDAERRAHADAPHLFRGGGFRSSEAHARSSDRYTLQAASYSGYDIGLRLARPLEPATTSPARDVESGQHNR